MLILPVAFVACVAPAVDLHASEFDWNKLGFSVPNSFYWVLDHTVVAK